MPVSWRTSRVGRNRRRMHAYKPFLDSRCYRFLESPLPRHQHHQWIPSPQERRKNRPIGGSVVAGAPQSTIKRKRISRPAAKRRSGTHPPAKPCFGWACHDESPHLTRDRRAAQGVRRSHAAMLTSPVQKSVVAAQHSHGRPVHNPFKAHFCQTGPYLRGLCTLRERQI